MSYFRNFPKVEYNGKSIVNITRRIKIMDEIRKNPLAYLSYFVKEEDRPENIAYYYYDDPYKVWLVYMSNDIIDPYSQWPLAQYDFEQTFIKKYAAQAKATNSDYIGYRVIEWGQNTLITDNIVHYRNNADKTLLINKDTFTYGDIETGDWTPVRYYEYENSLNDAKKNIFLLDRQYVDRVEKELENILNGS
jgi:hypothetical protein